MTHTITLDKNIEAAIARKARKLGVTTDDYLVQIAVAAVSAEESNPEPKTGAQLLEALRADGILTGYGDPSVDSVDLARKLRNEAQWRNHDT